MALHFVWAMGITGDWNIYIYSLSATVSAISRQALS